MNPELEQYIERRIIPLYAAFDRAHRIGHAQKVIVRSLELATHYNVDPAMVYTIAAYHDTGLANGREHHHIDSANILTSDPELSRWFTDEQIAIMHDAVEDHRASSDHEPRTIYGRIVAEADRLIDAETIIRRTVQYGLAHYPELDPEGHYERCCKHILHKYAEGGYLKLWIPESDNVRRLDELRAIFRDKRLFRQWFDHIFTHETDPDLDICARSFREQTGIEASELRHCFATLPLEGNHEEAIVGYLINGEQIIECSSHVIRPREAFIFIEDLATPDFD